MKKLIQKALIKKSSEEFKAMSEDDVLAWKKQNEQIEEENAKALAGYLEEGAKDIEKLTDAMKAQGLLIDEFKKEKAEANSGKQWQKELKDAFKSHVDSFKSMTKGSEVKFELKATQTYGDIDAGSDFAQMRPGVADSPVRRAGIIRSLFDMIPMTTEFYKYAYQDTVVRDAQNVALCGPITSTTKETLKVESIQTKMIKDIMKFCRQFVADYPFMQSRIRKLITQSVALRIDEQLLLGDGLGENLNSIDSVSSEFAANNVVCPINLSIQDATMVDLILGMRTQIVALGQENFFIPDTVLVNLCDWFTMVESRKDADGDYIDSRVSYINGMPYIGGMMVVTSPLVAAGTLYVFDSTYGEVVDRRMVTVEIATENASDWEQEIASIKAYERLNFLVMPNLKNAFMKCTNIDLAVADITKP